MILPKQEATIPKRPSNQQRMYVEKFGTMWFAVGGGVCAQGDTREAAIATWRATSGRRAKMGLRYE